MAIDMPGMLLTNGQYYESEAGIRLVTQLVSTDHVSMQQQWNQMKVMKGHNRGCIS